MRITRITRILFVAALALAAQLVVFAPQSASAQNIPWECTKPGFKYQVAQDGIHIRSSPNGPVAYSIAKGRTFLSSFPYDNSLGIECGTTQPDSNGVYWEYGQNASYPNQSGWVGVKWLTFEGSSYNY